MDVTKKKAAAIIATMIDKKVAEFESQVDSVKKELSARIDVIEQMLEKMSESRKTGEAVTKQELDSELNKIADRTIIKIEDFEKEFESEKKDIYELLGEARVKLEEMKEVYDNIKHKSDHIDSFIKDFVKKTQQVFDQSKKVDKEITSFKAEMNVKMNSLEKEIGKIEKTMVDTEQLNNKIEAVDKEVSEKIEKFLFQEEKRREEINKTIGSFDEKLKSLEKNIEEEFKKTAKTEDINKINSVLSKLSSIEETKKEVNKTSKKMEKALNSYENTMKSTIDSISKYRGVIESIKIRLNKLEASFLGTQHIAETTDKTSRQIRDEIASMRGKIGILEQYYKDPDRWLGDKVKSWFSQEMQGVQETINSLHSSISNQKADLLTTMLTLSLTRLANSDDYRQIVTESRALEHIVSVMKSGNLMHPETMEYLEQTLASTRDFWEMRNSDIASLIQSVIDRIKA